MIRKKKYNLEKLIEKSILDYLSYLPDCFAWKNNSVGVYDPIKKKFRKPRSRYLINGVSDIIGIYKQRPLFLEVKRTHAPSLVGQDQKTFLSQVKKMGAICGIVTSIDDVKKLLF